MGGGTGTGAAPVIAQLAREEGALTVGVVTKPFLFEGRQRSRRAELGLAQLTEHVDTLITIPNQKLLMLGEEDLSFIDAFRKADEVLFQAVKGISDLITQNGIVNVDFADVKTVMASMGRALMGTGIAKGKNRARLAAEMAISSPLLDDISVDGATGVLINIVGGPDLKMREIQEAASLVQEQAHEDANIIFGASIDEALGENVKVTVIATGFESIERMASLNEGARLSIPRAADGPVDAVRAAAEPAHGSAVARLAAPVFQQQPRSSSAAGAPRAARRPGVLEPPHPGAVSRDVRASSPASTRIPSRERATSNFPAFDTDWDVPAFQRKGQ